MAEATKEKLAHELIISQIDTHYDVGGMNRPTINEAIIRAMCEVLSCMRMATPHLIETISALEKIVGRRDCPGKEFILAAIQALREKISRPIP